jgi:hypothetical protein
VCCLQDTAKQTLLRLGRDAAEIDALGRWDRIALIRALSAGRPAARLRIAGHGDARSSKVYVSDARRAECKALLEQEMAAREANKPELERLRREARDAEKRLQALDAETSDRAKRINMLQELLNFGKDKTISGQSPARLSPRVQEDPKSSSSNNVVVVKDSLDEVLEEFARIEL